MEVRPGVSDRLTDPAAVVVLVLLVLMVLVLAVATVEPVSHHPSPARLSPMQVVVVGVLFLVLEALEALAAVVTQALLVRPTLEAVADRLAMAERVSSSCDI